MQDINHHKLGEGLSKNSPLTTPSWESLTQGQDIASRGQFLFEKFISQWAIVIETASLDAIPIEILTAARLVFEGEPDKYSNISKWRPDSDSLSDDYAPILLTYPDVNTFQDRSYQLIAAAVDSRAHWHLLFVVFDKDAAPVIPASSGTKPILEFEELPKLDQDSIEKSFAGIILEVYSERDSEVSRTKVAKRILLSPDLEEQILNTADIFSTPKLGEVLVDHLNRNVKGEIAFSLLSQIEKDNNEGHWVLESSQFSVLASYYQSYGVFGQTAINGKFVPLSDDVIRKIEIKKDDFVYPVYRRGWDPEHSQTLELAMPNLETEFSHHLGRTLPKNLKFELLSAVRTKGHVWSYSAVFKSEEQMLGPSYGLSFDYSCAHGRIKDLRLITLINSQQQFISDLVALSGDSPQESVFFQPLLRVLAKYHQLKEVTPNQILPFDDVRILPVNDPEEAEHGAMLLVKFKNDLFLAFSILRNKDSGVTRLFRPEFDDIRLECCAKLAKQPL